MNTWAHKQMSTWADEHMSRWACEHKQIHYKHMMTIDTLHAHIMHMGHSLLGPELLPHIPALLLSPPSLLAQCCFHCLPHTWTHCQRRLDQTAGQSLPWADRSCSCSTPPRNHRRLRCFRLGILCDVCVCVCVCCRYQRCLYHLITNIHWHNL